jgi:hypothetical protein
MAVTLTNYDSVLKKIYPPNVLSQMVAESSPLLGMMKKKTDMGKSYDLTLQYGVNQGLSATFADAQSGAGNNAYTAFVLTPVEYFAIAKWARQVLRASSMSKNSLVNALTAEMDGTLRSLVNELSFQIYGNRGLARAKNLTASGFTTTSCPVDNVYDLHRFEVGMEISLSADDGTTGAVRDSGKSVGITDIDRQSGTLTADANWSTISGATAGDYLFRKGDFPAVNTGLAGLEAWVPGTAPTSTAYFGVDRTSDIVRLGGMRKDISALTMEEGLIESLVEAAFYGASTDRVILNTINWGQLEKELGSKATYEKTRSTVAEIGYNSLVLNGPRKKVNVIADPWCPYDVAWLLQMDTWCLFSTGGAPELVTDDDQRILRNEAANTYEARMGWIAQPGCHAPGWNLRAALS